MELPPNATIPASLARRRPEPVHASNLELLEPPPDREKREGVEAAREYEEVW
eukprot:CAMPEP_0117764180 /NCGR_PEP_ID=MMETSP0947-20121206/19210_1 /TAXON_ID=44440 /ORGANISM="Chattonella subsalsa, Strain CCMP2191" /LENGTH=51 /DNA_ID=CAMNT_0005586289 /DNA_START=292 /DNA_END=444 /DNA_ORIENTATION=+